jgi:hypothetical protein
MNDANLARLNRVLDAAFEKHPEFLRPLLDPRQAASVPWRADVAATKRFLEWWSADREFREAVTEDAKAADRLNLGVDVDEIRFIWDAEFHGKVAGRKDWVAPKSVQQYRAWTSEKLIARRCAAVPAFPPIRATRRGAHGRTIACWGNWGAARMKASSMLRLPSN